MNDIVLIYSLITLGFFGGFSHCIGMCGPFVITQSQNRLQNIAISDYNNFQRIKNLALLPYHLGRITTYGILGGFSSVLATNIQNFIGFKIISAVFLAIAIMIFLNIFFEQKKFSILVKYSKFGLLFKTTKINFLPSFFKKKISSILKILFQNPVGIKGYILGILLGFIPCGLLYSALLICGNFESFLLATLAMIFFGLSTFPPLFLTTLGMDFFKKTSKFYLIGKIFILINILTLSVMLAKIISQT